MIRNGVASWGLAFGPFYERALPSGIYVAEVECAAGTRRVFLEIR